MPKVKEYELPKGEFAEEWVSKTWTTTEDEYYLKDQDNGTLYHFFRSFSYWTMIDLGFSHKDALATVYILAPVGEDMPSGDTSTWHLYNNIGDEVYPE